MNSTLIFCVHDNFKSNCQKCNSNKSSKLYIKACRALGCMKCKPGQTHYCYICKDNDTNHRSLNCPLKNSIYCDQFTTKKTNSIY